MHASPNRMPTMLDHRQSSRRRSSVALSSALSLVLLLVPATAFATALPTDTIAGAPLSDSGLSQSAPDVGASSGLVMDANGRLLWARDAEGQHAMASVTKIMTALLVLENADLDERVSVSLHASEVDYAIGLKPGERLTVRELLQFALVTSSNDAATALAEHVGDTESGFVRMMNARAEELDLDDTHYANPHGLDAAGHHSSATDIAALATIAMDDPEFRRIVAIEQLELPAYGDRPAEVLESTDGLLGVYEGLHGVKTGFTDDAGYCFVSEAQRSDIELMTVVLGTNSNDARFADTSRLLDWGFEHLAMQTIATTTETVGAIPIIQNPDHEVEIGFAETTATPVFDLDGEVARTISADTAVSLPVYEGQPLGEAQIHQGERVLATVPVVATKDISSTQETVGAVPVSDYIDVAVTARASDEVLDVPEFDPDTLVVRTILLDPEIEAPVAIGDPLGTIVYAQDDDVILTVPVVAAGDVEAPSTLERVGIWFERAWNWITGEPGMATLQIQEG